MKEGVFEFKGVMYRRFRGSIWNGSTGWSVERVGEVPDYRPHRASKEIIPDHLRFLNKKQLRARIIELEKQLDNCVEFGTGGV